MRYFIGSMFAGMAGGSALGSLRLLHAGWRVALAAACGWPRWR